MRLHNRWYIVLFLVTLAGVAQPSSQAAQGCNSPTGRNPKLFWTPALQCVWDREKAENHPWYQLVIANANAERYNDMGRWETQAYLMTGDRAFAQKAFLGIKRDFAGFSPAGDTQMLNVAAWNGFEWVWEYNALQPALTVTQDAEMLSALKRLAEGILKGARFGDSDLMVGHYFTLAFLDVAAGTRYLERSIPDDFGVPRPVGGLDATAADSTSMRNTIRHYVEHLAAGGQWIESTDYNLQTTQVVHLGAYGIRTATGVDHFPEMTTFLSAQARHLMHEMTPDLKDSAQWGDVQAPRMLAFHDRLPLYGIVGALTPEPLGAAFRQFEADVMQTNGIAFAPMGNPLYARYFYLANPYLSKAPWREAAGTFLTTPGVGHAYWRTGTEPTARFVHAFFPAFSNGAVDHFVNTFGDLRWYGNGLWLLDRPIGYAPDQNLGNQVLVMNAGPSLEAGGLIASATKEAEFAYVAGVNAGISSLTYAGAYGLVPTYLHENSRSVFILPRSLVIFDRVHAEDPRDLVTRVPGPNGTTLTYDWKMSYPYAQQQTTINAARGVKDVIFQTPVAPTMTSTGFQWPVGNQTVRVVQVFPTESLRREIVDWHTTAVGGYVAESEKKFSVHATPTIKQDFDTFLHVLTTDPAVRPVALQAAKVRGVLLDDIAVLFSAQPGPKLATTYGSDGRIAFDPTKITSVATGRLLRESFTVTLPRVATVYFADLDPGLAWTVNDVPLTKQGDLFVMTATGKGRRVGALNVKPNGATSSSGRLPVPVLLAASELNQSTPVSVSASGRELKVIRLIVADNWEEELAPFFAEGWRLIGSSSGGIAVLARDAK